MNVIHLYWCVSTYGVCSVIEKTNCRICECAFSFLGQFRAVKNRILNLNSFSLKGQRQFKNGNRNIVGRIQQIVGTHPERKPLVC